MAMPPPSPLWDWAMYLAVFLCGMVMVKRFEEWRAKRVPRGRSRSSSAGSTYGGPLKRPPTQMPVQGFAELVEATGTQSLVRSVERRTRLTPGNWQRDCQPALEAYAEFVQMLPASECHHHAQPGGLLIHTLEVVDAALTFRGGMEIPVGAGTEERKRDEHRWTVAILLGALLHDAGKPATDVRVTLFQEDPRAGKLWQPLAGSMKAFSAHWYSVGFADPSERDYEAHAKVGAMLLQSLVPQRTLRWLSESPEVLNELLAYLSGESPDGVIADIVKRADSDSVRRNLLHGPRTRFASARAVPLIERLMAALRRMLQEGAQLPLNRPGAAGWVHDGCAWFVCARLADEVRSYLEANESGQGIPGKDKNDRLFDTWQEHGAVRSGPDGGAVWRVRVRCDAWAPPDALTVLCFPLDKLYPDPAQYPPNVAGEVVPVGAASTPAASAPGPVAKPVVQPSQRIEPQLVLPPIEPPPTQGAAAGSATAAASAPKAGPPPTAAAQHAGAAAPQVLTGRSAPAVPKPEPTASAAASPGPAAPAVAESPAPVVGPAPQYLSGRPSPFSTLIEQDPDDMPAVIDFSSGERGKFMAPPDAGQPGDPQQDGILAAHEAADLGEHRASAQQTPVLTLTAPLRPRERTAGHPKPPKMPSPAAQAFLGWVAQAVGTGELRYNEDQAMVHFVAEGALLLSPEIFRRFFEVHRSVADGPIAELRTSHGDSAYKRLQNELARSGFTLRNGDENLHYFAAVKADGSLSRPASFYLLRQPELLWNPVPRPNERLKRTARPAAGPKKLTLPATAGAATTRGRSTESEPA